MREKGYYWVKYDGEWSIAEWSEKHKQFDHWDIGRDESEFEEIDERKIVRDETPDGMLS